MATAADRARWEHTSVVAAFAVSSFQKRILDPDKINPYKRQRIKARRSRVDPAAFVTMLADAMGAKRV